MVDSERLRFSLNVDERLLWASTALLDQTDAPSLSTSAVCALAGAARSSVAMYYGSLDRLLAAASTLLFDRLLTDIETDLDSGGVVDPAHRAEVRIVRMQAWLRSRPHINRMIFDQKRNSSQFPAGDGPAPLLFSVCGDDLWLVALSMGIGLTAMLSDNNDVPRYEGYLEACARLLGGAVEPYVPGRLVGTASSAGLLKEDQFDRSWPVVASDQPDIVVRPKKRGRKPGGTQTASLLVQSAIGLLERGESVSSISVTKIAKNAHHVPAAVYNHYENVGALLFEARRVWVQRLDDMELPIAAYNEPIERIVRRIFLLAEDARALPEFYKEISFREPTGEPWPYSFKTLAETSLLRAGLSDTELLIAAGVLPRDSDAFAVFRGLAVFVRGLLWLVIYEPSAVVSRWAEIVESMYRSLRLLFWGVADSSSQAGGEDPSKLWEVLNAAAEPLVRSLSADLARGQML